MTRQIVLDTETTGLETQQGHRLIEIGCIEVINRRATGNRFHQYLNPDREIDEGAQAVHGISTEFLADKPRFADIASELMAFLDGAELVIHNAAFDIGFINHELKLLGPEHGRIEDRCTVLDTLALARKMHPGQKNSLDALCKRYFIDNSHRELHGALLDAEILLDVYLGMTGGQVSLSLGQNDASVTQFSTGNIKRLPVQRVRLPVIKASETELLAHEAILQILDKKTTDKDSPEGKTVWRKLEPKLVN